MLTIRRLIKSVAIHFCQEPSCFVIQRYSGKMTEVCGKRRTPPDYSAGSRGMERWREKNRQLAPDLRRANLAGAILSGEILIRSQLVGAVHDAAGGELYGYHSTHTMPNDDCLWILSWLQTSARSFAYCSMVAYFPDRPPACDDSSESGNQRFRLGEGRAGCRLRESFGSCG